MHRRTSRILAAASPRGLSVRARRLYALGAIVAAAAIVVVSSLGAGETEGYKIRIVFVNSAGITKGANIRVAGANVGSIESIYVGKNGLASVVVNVTDPAFQRFYTDAKCRIRLQSLIGEKFIDCDPGSPTKEEIAVDPADDERRILPSSQTGSPVDPDELLNAMREPQRERFRVIINELGVTLTGRGQDLQDILDRFDPTFLNVNKTLKILARENRNLVRLAENGDKSVQQLADSRESIAGLFKNADAAARATNAKQAELALTLQRLPEFLDELEQTAPVLENFANQAAPVAASTRAASADLSEFVTGTEAFVDSANPALKRFGDTADVLRAQIPALQPVAESLNAIGKERGAVTNLKRLLQSFEGQNGYANLGALAVGLAGAGNGTDAFGHFMRSMIVVPGSCFNYVQERSTGCSADFGDRSGSNSEPEGKSSQAPTVSSSSELATDAAALDYLLGSDN
ncbi:MAG: MCE family protein [Thermoleophilaceae bacterium]|nr:MCE family protein [Thermoleophilaceae bacterium]